MFLRSLGLFLVPVALVGCLAAPDEGTPPIDPGLPPVISHSPEFYLPESEEFAEPGIKVAPDGTVYVTAPGARSSTPVGPAPVRGDTVWRSDDGGSTFTVLPIPDAGFGGGDSDLAVASDGTLYQSGLWGGCVSLSVSNDRGESWTTNPLACGYAAGSDDRNWLAVHGSQTVYLTFGWAPNPVGEGRMALVKSVVEGEAAAVTTASFEDNYQWPGNIAVDQESGVVYIAYNTVDDEIVVLRSMDEGMTLEKRSVSQRTGDTFDSFGVVAVGRDGTAYVTWSERDGTDEESTTRTDVFYSYSLDAGDSWAEPVRVNAFVGTHIYPWLDAGEAGHLALAWYGTNTTGGIAEKIDGTWWVYAAESRTANTGEPLFVESVVSAEPVTQGGICTSGTGCVPGTRDLLDYFQVALDPEGVPHYAWATRAWGEHVTPTSPVALAYAKQLTP